MAKRVKVFLLLLAFVAVLISSAFASGGSSADPLVSKSYADGTFFDNVVSDARARVSAAVSSFKNKYISRAEEAVKIPYNDGVFVSAVADAVLDSMQEKGKYLFSTSSLAPKRVMSGDVISASGGTVIVVNSGSAKCVSGSLVNLTRGVELSSGNAMGRFTAFMFPEGGAKVEITSKQADVLIDGTYSLAGYDIRYMDEAYALKKLGLVRGAANGMELYRGNTRAESITMLIRLLGEEENALSALHSHPFTDVDEWAKRYVGYAYRMNYTKGVSNTRFDGSSFTTAQQYVTFILRALGYSEAAGDFRYETALSDAVRLGVIDSSVSGELQREEFRRDHVMHLSYLAMSAKMKGSNRTLLAHLVANGAVDGSRANEFSER